MKKFLRNKASYSKIIGVSIIAFAMVVSAFVFFATPIEADNGGDNCPEGCPDCLVSYWKLDESSGDTAADFCTCNGNDGTLHNGPTWTTGQVNGALDFDGVDDYVSIDDDSSLDIDDKLTVECWFKVDEIPGDNGFDMQNIISKDTNYEFHVHDNGKLYWWWENASDENWLYSETIIQPDNWYHVAVIYNEPDQSAKMYLNGVKENETSVNGFLKTNDVPLHFGKNHFEYPRHFDGKIDEVAIYDCAISENDVIDHYFNGLAGLGICEMDTEPPTMEEINEEGNQCYNEAPVFSNFGFDDNHNLDQAWYKIDEGSWITIFEDIDASEWNDNGWELPGFNGLSQGVHTVYFKVKDDVGNYNGRECDDDYYAWSFCKDTIDPNIQIELDGKQVTKPGYAWPMIGPHTEVWLNATDSGCSGGAEILEYSFMGGVPGSYVTVIDDGPGDENDNYGEISVNLTFDDDCHHQINYRAKDYCGNWYPSATGSEPYDFYVDATPPDTQVEVQGIEIPYEPGSEYTWMGSCAIKWINVTDSGCEDAWFGGAGAEYVNIVVSLDMNPDPNKINYEIIENYKIYDQYPGHDVDPVGPYGYEDIDPTYGNISVAFVFHEDCQHEVMHWAVDYVENNETSVWNTDKHKQNHYVDITPPETYFDIYEGTSCENDEGTCLTMDTIVDIDIVNAGTDPCKYPETMTFFRVFVPGEGWYPDKNGEGNYDVYGPSAEREKWKGVWWYKYTEHFQFTEECKHYLEYFGKDSLCNTEDTHNLTIFVDDQSPVIIKTIHPPNYATCESCTNDLVNPGFETGDLTGWNIDQESDIIEVVMADEFTSPYTGDYMIKLGDDHDYGYYEQPKGPNQISQVFTVTQDTFAFAYNIFTYDYPPFNHFEYKLETMDGTTVAYYKLGAWGEDDGQLEETGWTVVAIDVSNYIGEQLKLTFNSEGTLDDAVPTWAYVDCAPETGIFVRPDTILEINATDMGCCDVLSYVGYQVNEESWQPITELPYEYWFGEECEHTFKIKARDCLGHETIHTETFYVDGTPPIHSKEVGQPNCTYCTCGMDEDDYCITSQTPIWINATDDGTEPCIVGSYYIHWEIWNVTGNYMYDSGVSHNQDVILYIDEECEHTVSYWVEDNLGNRDPAETWHTETFYVDNIYPEIDKIVGDPNCTGICEGDYCVTTETPIYLKAWDDGCCPCPITFEYRIWNDTHPGEWLDVTSLPMEGDYYNLTFDEECLHNLSLRATDCLGYTTYHEDETFYVDESEPYIEKTVGEPNCYKGPFVDFDTLEVSIPGVVIVDPNDIWCVSTDTEITIDAWDLGCCGILKNVSYRIQNETHGWGPWKDIMGYLDGDDDNGLDDYYFTFEEECFHMLEIQAEDCLGNIERDLEIFLVDDTDPYIEKTVKDPNCTEDEETYCVTTDTEITIDAWDQGCCGVLENVSYRIWFDGSWGPWKDIMGYLDGDDDNGLDDYYFTFELECEHKLEIQARDCLGNTVTDLETFYVDNQPPRFGKLVGDPNCSRCVPAPSKEYNLVYGESEYPTGTVKRSMDEENIFFNITIDKDTQYSHTEFQLIISGYPGDGINWLPQGSLAKIGVNENGPYFTIADGGLDLNGNGIYETPHNNYGWWANTEDKPFPQGVTVEGETGDFYFNITIPNMWGCGQKIYWAVNVGADWDQEDDNQFSQYPGNWNKWKCKGEFAEFQLGELEYCVTTDTPIHLGAMDMGCCINDSVTIEYKKWKVGECVPEEWTTYDEPFHFESECEHILLIRAYDCLGNGKEEIYWHEETFYVDEKPPILHKKVGEPSFTDDEKVWWVTTETEINLTAEDQGCCPSDYVLIKYKIWYQGQWSDWIIYDGNFTFDKGCTHYLLVNVSDCLGNYMLDNETFIVHGPGGDDDPEIAITDPTLFDEPHCEKTLEVMLEASDLETASENLIVKVWIPGGRRDAPTLWYDATHVSGDTFHTFIDIFKYQDGAELTLWAAAMDEDDNVEFAMPVPFTVCSTTVWDQWMQQGWNKLTLPYGAIGCDNSVESVLASINNGNFDVVWYYDADDEMFPWKSWVYGEPTNQLEEMFTGEEYWVHIAGDGMRYYTDTNGPSVNIEYPIEGTIFEDELDDDIHGTAYDLETGIKEVIITIYDNDTGEYWNGVDDWTTDYTELEVTGKETWVYEDTEGITYTGRSGHKIIVTAMATDYGSGCTTEDTTWYKIETIEPSLEFYKEVEEQLDYAEIEVGEEGLFHIVIHNTGNCDLYNIIVNDTLPAGLQYTAGEAWFSGEDLVSDPTETINGNVITWDYNGYILENYTALHIYLPVTVTGQGEQENLAEIEAYHDLGMLSSCDTSTIYGIETCVADMDMQKTVWCPDTEQWVTEKPAYCGEEVRFNISVYNDGSGACALSEIKIEDNMWEQLTYANEINVVCPSGISYTFEMSADGKTLYWNFTGDLEPGEYINIEFNATVNWMYECDYTYNDANGDAYCANTDEDLDGFGSVELWDQSCEY